MQTEQNSIPSNTVADLDNLSSHTAQPSDSGDRKVDFGNSSRRKTGTKSKKVINVMPTNQKSG